MARKTTQNAVASRQWADFSGVDPLMAEAEPDDYEVHLEHFNQVDETITAFARCSTVTMADFLVPLDERSGQYCLKLCSAVLHRKNSEGQLGGEGCNSLLDQLLALIEDVETVGDLDASLRVWLLGRLREVRRVLE